MFQRAHVLLAAALFLAVFGLACSDENAAPDATPCPRVSIEECFVGALFAECPTELPSGSVFACDPASGCRWFTNGCVADGFVASRCEASNICCDGLWPFPTSGEPRGVYPLFYSFGNGPWDRDTAAVVSVNINPDLAVDATEFSCVGDPGGGGIGPCTKGASSPPGAFLFDTLLLQVQHSGLFGWYPWIEILRDGESFRSRVCAATFTDTFGGTCPNRAPRCADGGTLTLNRWPASAGDLAGVAVEFSTTFADETEFVGTILVP